MPNPNCQLRAFTNTISFGKTGTIADAQPGQKTPKMNAGRIHNDRNTSFNRFSSNVPQNDGQPTFDWLVANLKILDVKLDFGTPGVKSSTERGLEMRSREYKFI